MAHVCTFVTHPVTLRSLERRRGPISHRSSASCEVFSVLKRVDEKSVTEKAFANPKFVEDIVRDVAKQLNADDNITWFSVSAENFESIHNHSAFASITSG